MRHWLLRSNRRLAQRVRNLNRTTLMKVLGSLILASILSACSTAPIETPEKRFSHQVLFTISNSFAEIRNKPGQYDAAFAKNLAKSRPADMQSVINTVVNIHGLKKISQWSVKPLGVEAVVAEFKDPRTMVDVISALERDQRIESVQSIKTYSLLNYNDPYFNMQNALEIDDLEKVHKYATGKNVVVGIVDTGIDRNHPELTDRIIYTKNFVDHDQQAFDNDEHGTAVAGIISSAANNDLGIVGVAPDAGLMVFKACSENNRTKKANCDSYSLMKGLVDVLAKRPDILNLSLAGPPDPLLERLIIEAINRGIIVTAAVYSKQSDRMTFPAGVAGVIAVNASQSVGMGDSPSNGVIAPGMDMLTTTPGATYAFRSGSSMSTAFVTGIAALVKERYPDLTAERFMHLLNETSTAKFNSLPIVSVCNAVITLDDVDVCSENTLAEAD